MLIDTIVEESDQFRVERGYSHSGTEILGINNNIDDNMLNFIESITKQYTCIKFTQVESSDEILARLFDIINKKKITHVLFSADNEEVKNIDNIIKHISNTNIERITISGNAMSFSVSTHLILPNIKELILHKVSRQNMDINLIKMFPNLETLRFTCRHHNMTSQFKYTSEEIFHMIQCSNIYELGFSVAFLIDDNSTFATQLITVTNLTKIRLDFCDIFGISNDFVKCLAADNKITYLELINPKRDYVEQIAEILKYNSSIVNFKVTSFKSSTKDVPEIIINALSENYTITQMDMFKPSVEIDATLARNKAIFDNKHFVTTKLAIS